MDDGESSNALATLINDRSARFLTKFTELETKFNEEENNERSAATISRYPLHIHQRAPEIRPRVVSIGPFFYGDSALQDMEKLKEELMFDLLSKQHARALLPILIAKIAELEESASECYSGNIELGHEEFAQMLLVDSCFIIRFLVSMNSQETHESLLSLDWNIKEIRSDLLLMGNQIPLSVVRNVYAIIQTLRADSLPRNFSDIVGQFLGMDISWEVSKDVSCLITHHLLDLYWLYFMPDELEVESRIRPRVNVNAPLRDGYIYTPTGAARNIPSATELNRVAGVIFKKDKSNSIAKFHKGIFEMSALKIDENMKIIITNLLGYEKNFPLQKRKVSSYILLLDSLINTEEDVALLQESGIIVNALDTNLSAAIFFNDVGNMCTVDYTNHRFAKLFRDVRKHHNSKLKRTLASLRRDYCNSAWARISVAAAIILLLLTVAQTILTGVQTQYTIHPNSTNSTNS